MNVGEANSSFQRDSTLSFLFFIVSIKLRICRSCLLQVVTDIISTRSENATGEKGQPNRGAPTYWNFPSNQSKVPPRLTTSDKKRNSRKKKRPPLSQRSDIHGY